MDAKRRTRQCQNKHGQTALVCASVRTTTSLLIFGSYVAQLKFKQIIHDISDKFEGDTKNLQRKQCNAALRRVEMRWYVHGVFVCGIQ